MKNFEVAPLIDRYGSVVTAADLRAYADEVGMSYQTLTKKLEQFKVHRGMWHLTAIEQLEQTYNQPAVEPVVEIAENFIPEKDASFVSFGNFSDIKKIVSSRQYYALINSEASDAVLSQFEVAVASSKQKVIDICSEFGTD